MRANALARPEQPNPHYFATVLRELSALANFMHADGREAFAGLSMQCQRELQDAFQRLTVELQRANGTEVNHG
ncbi:MULTISPECIES: hypothetical protein [Cupriavidus]|uniref:Uncharacterized protein n=1 Tax=Cupriavidus numazuensis TaxID=221992 RepID=A0ABN7QE97_9BURK|nr:MULTISPECIES: hypothetical protein [Cupriavidus]MBP0633500.1 hypothetical protein [Cupriavidus sp. AcVe19-1a]CAG2159549.1 hypothetical protein LMG26411_06786 [Cupriavidus numazuensis]